MAKGHKTGGRKPGSVNKTTAKLKAAAQKHTKAALETIVKLMTSGDTDQVKLAAAREVLDRGYGKAPQAIADADGNNLPMPTRVIHEYLS